MYFIFIQMIKNQNMKKYFKQSIIENNDSNKLYVIENKNTLYYW
jgi:hypothetical protein